MMRMNRPPEPFDFEEHSRKLVRRAVLTQENQPTTPLCEAVMDVAMGSKVEWTPAEIDALNAELDRCRLNVGAWLEGQGHGEI